MTTASPVQPDVESLDALDALIQAVKGEATTLVNDPTVREEDAGTEEAPGNNQSLSVNIRGNQYVTRYDTDTGASIKFDVAHADLVLTYKRQNGSPMYSETQPTSLPDRAMYPCVLHASNPKRAQFDRFGLRHCTMTTLSSPKEVKDHMAVYHASDMRVIQDWLSTERERSRDERVQFREERLTRAMEMLASSMQPQQQEPEPPVLVAEPPAPGSDHAIHTFKRSNSLAGCTQENCNVRYHEALPEHRISLEADDISLEADDSEG